MRYKSFCIAQENLRIPASALGRIRERAPMFPQKGLRGWLRYKLWRLLDRIFFAISDEHFETQTSFKRVDISGETLAEVVREAVGNMRNLGADADFIVVGHEEFYRSLDEAVGMQGVGFQTHIDPYVRGCHTVLGYDVRIVPGFSGVLVVPKAERTVAV